MTDLFSIRGLLTVRHHPVITHQKKRIGYQKAFDWDCSHSLVTVIWVITLLLLHEIRVQSMLSMVTATQTLELLASVSDRTHVSDTEFVVGPVSTPQALNQNSSIV